ncbi:MAG: aminotransferase class I/II-fold pyridoxal phosphate-dependent enzyme [Candidatus Obscuribacterales bacterium]
MQQAIKVDDLISAAEERLAGRFKAVDGIALVNQERVLAAFRHHRLTEEYFAAHTGYGLDDAGREVLDNVFASVFGGEAACVRVQFVSGTHALACAILGNVEPGGRFVCLTGPPYDSLEEVLGIAGDEPGSLKRLGVEYIELDLDPLSQSETAMIESIERVESAGPASVFYIQKSRGYSSSRRTFSGDDIAKLCQAVRKVNASGLVIVDNCYGEFVEDREPLSCGADLIAGSLIKNPGGGLAIAGGYIAGKRTAVEAALNRLTAPGVGGHMGLSFGENRLLFQGLFMAPFTVSQAVKGAMLIASVFEELGMRVSPGSLEERFDIIQQVEFGQAERLINFCKAVQRFSPVNAHVDPEPCRMPGYQDEVIMAGGTFVEGSTIELSADGPLRPPYSVFIQGGLSYQHVKCTLRGALTLSLSLELPFI